MPQFDFFIWFSLSLWTIFSFQILYYFLVYFIIAPFSNLQKTLIKLHLLPKFIYISSSPIAVVFKKIFKN